tara:strand:+ start:433 stop:840 length:408 start_codon:yes stop_codon:yes gene_type:complete
MNDIIEYLKDNLPNVPVEVGKKQAVKLTNSQKARIVGEEAIKQANELEQKGMVAKKSDWIQEENEGQTFLVVLKYRNQLIPVSGREKKIRVPSFTDGILVLRKLGQDLIDGKLDDLMNKTKERKKRTNKSNTNNT